MAGNAETEVGTASAATAESLGAEPGFMEELEAADKGCKKYMNKANGSNMLTFVVMVIGLILELSSAKDDPEDGVGWTRYVLSFGLFGFAGGVTNFLAITMLFDEIPGVYGSGIIPKQFEEIKLQIAQMIMDTFFEPEFIRRYASQRTEALGNKDNVKKLMKEMMESDAFDKLLDDKLAAMKSGKSFSGIIMKTFSISGDTVKPMLKRLLGLMSGEITKILLKAFDPNTFFDDAAVFKLRAQIDTVIHDRLRELTADKVKKLMEMVIRVHLGWLVVWGNIFGGIIGVASAAAGY